MGVTLGGAEVGMAEEGLNVADVGAAFEEVSGESMAKAVNRNFFLDGGALNSFVENALG